MPCLLERYPITSVKMPILSYRATRTYKKRMEKRTHMNPQWKSWSNDENVPQLIYEKDFTLSYCLIGGGVIFLFTSGLMLWAGKGD